jgi:hypothetical protein
MHRCSGELGNQEVVSIEDLKLRKKEGERWAKPRCLAYDYSPETGEV